MPHSFDSFDADENPPVWMRPWPLRGIGVVLLVVGVALILKGFLSDVTVMTSDFRDIVNTDLVQQRLSLLIVGSGLFAGGCAFMVGGEVLNRLGR